MGNLYRFVEPLVLLQLKQKGHSYGYDLCAQLKDHAFTDATIEKAALYRTLRQLETNGNVKSEWETNKVGPARRVYKITKQGERHLKEWAAMLEHLSQSMTRFVSEAREVLLRPAVNRPRSL
jgi:poly-beta-hydroxybutyrate-responsive repressor